MPPRTVEVTWYHQDTNIFQDINIYTPKPDLQKNRRLKPLLRKSTGYADKITHHFYIWDKVFIQLEKKPACQFVIFDLKALAEIYKWFDKYLNRIFLYSIFILSTCDSLINQSCISPPSVKLFFINMFLRYNFMALNKILVNEYIFMRYDTYICTCILDLYGQKRK